MPFKSDAQRRAVMSKNKRSSSKKYSKRKRRSNMSPDEREWRDYERNTKKGDFPL